MSNAAEMVASSPHTDVAAAVKRIASALKTLTGKRWSVSHGRGTAYGWIDINVLPAARLEFGYMPEAARAELAAIMGTAVHHQGLSISPDERTFYVLRAEAKVAA